MKTTSLLTLAYIFILSSCEKINIIPSPSMISNWEEIAPPADLVFEGTTVASLNFNSDSSYQLVYHKWNDEVRFGDPCLRVSTYFVKGDYKSKSDYVTFNGCFTDKSFRDCITRCDGVLNEVKGYRYILTQDTLKLLPVESPDSPRILVRTN